MDTLANPLRAPRENLSELAFELPTTLKLLLGLKSCRIKVVLYILQHKLPLEE